MKDFRRRLELRLLVEHETRMAQPPEAFAPVGCQRCGGPTAPRPAKGRREAYCDACKNHRKNERARIYRERQRRAELRKARYRQLQARVEK